MDEKPSLFVLGSFVVACSAHVNRFPGRGESAHATRFIVEPGGKGFNLATGMHRLGANVDSIFAVGDDAFGRIADAAFEQAGFKPSLLRTCGGGTGSGIGFTDASGETSLAIYPGANFLLSAADVAAVAKEIRSARVVVAQFEISDAPIDAAFALAKQHGVTTLLNPSPFRMPSRTILENTSGLIMNEVEASALAAALGETAFSEAVVEAVFALGPRLVIVTEGSKGATVYQRGQPTLMQPAFRVVAVDSLGAGDAFLAAFAVRLAQDFRLEDCLRGAAAAGALATLQPGVFQALATHEELMSFLADREGGARHFDPIDA